MERERRVRVSKLLSLALRHEPSALGLNLDERGWTAVDAVITGLHERGEEVTRDELEEVVATSDKQRFALSPDGTKMRANQGHSIAVELGLDARKPPELLFHGTAARFLESILTEGLIRGARTHVHLSADEETAVIVAKRRAGPHVILHVRARAMHEAGGRFYLSDNGVWLAEHVPAEYVVRPDGV